MSYTATADAIALQVPATMKMVLVALADFKNEVTGACYPRVRKIAEKSGLSESTVKRWLRRARIMGLISWNHLIRKDGSHGPNAYRLIFHRTRPRPRKTPQDRKTKACAEEPTEPEDQGPFTVRVPSYKPKGWLASHLPTRRRKTHRPPDADRGDDAPGCSDQET